ncbi:MAG TPA: hypothetical protein VGB72_05735 [Acidobacteriota bacterium]
MDDEKRSRFFDPYHQRKEHAPGRSFWLSFLLSLMAVFGLSFSLTCLYLGMRGIMRLGGFVAAGGPYMIAHPAPRYVWIFPVSIWLGLICVFIHGVQVRKLGGLNLVPLAWPALFISLGWNFLDFAFRPPGGGRLVWGWLVCGVVFWLMGFVPLIWALIYARQKYRELRFKEKLNEPPASGQSGGGSWKRKIIFLFQLTALFLGIYCGMALMSPQTKAQGAIPAAAAGEPATATRTTTAPLPAPVPGTSGKEEVGKESHILSLVFRGIA